MLIAQYGIIKKKQKQNKDSGYVPNPFSVDPKVQMHIFCLQEKP